MTNKCPISLIQNNFVFKKLEVGLVSHRRCRPTARETMIGCGLSTAERSELSWCARARASGFFPEDIPIDFDLALPSGVRLPDLTGGLDLAGRSRVDRHVLCLRRDAELSIVECLQAELALVEIQDEQSNCR